MAKPIFLIGFPFEAENDAVYHVQNDLSAKLEGEYHVIAYKIPNLESIKFEVLNAINSSDIEIEELIKRAESFTQTVIRDYEERFKQLLNESLNKIEENKNNPE